MRKALFSGRAILLRLRKRVFLLSRQRRLEITNLVKETEVQVRGRSLFDQLDLDNLLKFFLLLVVINSKQGFLSLQRILVLAMFG